MKKLILIIVLALVSTAAWGSDYWNAGGAGLVGCGTYVKDYKEDGIGHLTQVTWVLGFISGGNLARYYSGENPMIGKGLDHDSIALWLDNYCRENPLDQLAQAADDLVDELEAKANK